MRSNSPLFWNCCNFQLPCIIAISATENADFNHQHWWTVVVHFSLSHVRVPCSTQTHTQIYFAWWSWWWWDEGTWMNNSLQYIHNVYAIEWNAGPAQPPRLVSYSPRHTVKWNKTLWYWRCSNSPHSISIFNSYSTSDPDACLYLPNLARTHLHMYV